MPASHAAFSQLGLLVGRPEDDHYLADRPGEALQKSAAGRTEGQGRERLPPLQALLTTQSHSMKEKIMTGELVRYLAMTPAEREQGQALEKITRNVDVAVARVGGITHVAQSGLVGVLTISMTKKQATMLAPEDSDKFEFIATTGAVGIATEIQRLANRL